MIEQTPQDKTLCDLVTTGTIGASLAVVFQCVRLARRNADGRPLSWAQIAVELCGAGAVGALVAWGLESVNIGRELSAVIIAMSGYVGGPLLDIVYREGIELVQAAFDGAEKWLGSAGWDKNRKD